MTRREIRENVFKLIFMEEFHSKDEFNEIAAEYMESTEQMSDEDCEYVTKRAKQVIAKMPEIDEAISNVSKGWTLDRIGRAELAILRLAYFEMNMDEQVPKKVAIDEAVELAKKYSADAGGAFVNGILAKLMKEE